MYYMLHIKPYGGYSIWIDDPCRKGYIRRYKTVTPSDADKIYPDSMEKSYLARHITSKSPTLKNLSYMMVLDALNW